MKSSFFGSAPLMISLLVAAVFGPAAASAATLKPGLWTLGGVQEICLVRGGTWYSTTFPGWNGRWDSLTANGDRGFIQGNYPSAGSDSVVVGAARMADWTEWRDYTALIGFLDVRLGFVSRTCGPPAVSTRMVRQNPMD